MPVNAVNINTIESQIDNCVISFFDNYNIDLHDLDQCKKIPHNTVNLCFRYIYKSLFKPDVKLINNQKSIIDYSDANLLQVLADKYIDICQMFNKSLGLMSFSFMTGIDYKTLYNWLNDPRELNSLRFQVLKNIQECHKMSQIALLNDTPVGALAVANNDKETGLNWSENNAQQVTSNTVYILPSERSGRLNLEKLDN